MTTDTATAVAPEAPGRLGAPLDPREALDYLAALRSWCARRRTELERLDEAALASPHRDALTGDVQLAMALWKSVADRMALLESTWDSGRAGVAEREQMATLVWARRATTDLAVSLPEACRLSDALAAALRARLSLDPVEADVAARVRALRAQVERVRDLVTEVPRDQRDGAADRLDRVDRTLSAVVADAGRGADVGGRLPVIEADAARLERDLIVGASRRREAAHDRATALGLRTELEARGAAVRSLAARAVAEVSPAPRLAVPDVSALGDVPHDEDAVDAYLERLAAVTRALEVARTTYQAALDEREDLAGMLTSYAAKAASADLAPGAVDDLAALHRRASGVLAAPPVDLPRVRGLVAAYQAYLVAARATGRTPPPGRTP